MRQGLSSLTLVKMFHIASVADVVGRQKKTYATTTLISGKVDGSLNCKKAIYLSPGLNDSKIILKGA